MARYCRGLNPQLIAAAPKLQRQEPKLDTRTDSPGQAETPSDSHTRVFKLHAEVFNISASDDVFQVNVSAPYFDRKHRRIKGTLIVNVPKKAEVRRDWHLSGGVRDACCFSSASVKINISNNQEFLLVTSLADRFQHNITQRDFNALKLPNPVRIYPPPE
jgi:hypothetical protein